ncbi:hypothetical protein [Halomicrobium urmianum]|uniref:hypothetical protein n=1 Tax=Halomicrobium urmianum TaxID=1586233 RepID=UPI001CD94A19|nr:hypothetical protein [Halomicrobium urmianum]
MPELEVLLRTDAGVETYVVEGALKRPGPAVEAARERAAADGHEEVSLEAVRLAEPA